MIDVAIILGMGALASIMVLIIAPLPLIYVAAFVAFTPILGIALWRARGALFGAIGVRGDPLRDFVVERLDENAPALAVKEADEAPLQEALAPAPDLDFGLIGSPASLVRAEPVGSDFGARPAPASRDAAPVDDRTAL